MKRSRSRRTRAHLVLVHEPPQVYVGPNARRALRGERGVLLGARRYARVDVFEFDPEARASIGELVDLRFSDRGPWDVVGLSLSSSDLRRSGERLLRDLVPGDVLLTERGPRVHSGASWVEAKLTGDRSRSAT